jgi:hypothetical protein
LYRADAHDNFLIFIVQIGFLARSVASFSIPDNSLRSRLLCKNFATLLLLVGFATVYLTILIKSLTKYALRLV